MADASPGLPPFLLFDLDDTILRFGAVAAEAWRQVCARETADPAFADELRRRILAAGAWYWDDADRHREGRLDLVKARRRLVRAALLAPRALPPAAYEPLYARVLAAEAAGGEPEGLDRDEAELADAVALAFTELRESLVEPFPGALETLAELVRRGHVLALVTNGSPDTQRAKVERFGLAAHFAAVCIEGEMGFGKPDPRAYRQALSLLGAEPAAAWMVGDNLVWDVRGARDAGIGTVWHDWEGTGLPADPPAVPDRIIRALPELLAV